MSEDSKNQNKDKETKTENYINQHIVPRRYLRRFAVQNNGKYRIQTRIVIKGQEKYISPLIDNVGFRKRIYDVTDKENPKFWENYLGEIDGLYGKRLEDIIAIITLSNDGYKVLTTKDKADISKMMVAQIFREPENINHTKDIYKKILFSWPETIKMISGLPSEHVAKYRNEKEYVENDEQSLKEIYLDFFFSCNTFDYYCQLLQSYNWIVYYNTLGKSCPFITSDNPVVIENTSNKKFGLFKSGLESPNTRIFYPLSPEIAILLLPKNKFDDSIDCKKMVIKNSNAIIKMNLMVISQANQHSFVSEELFHQWCK